MNSSNLITNVLKYLKVKNNDQEIIDIIEDCIKELEDLNSFKCIYRRFDYNLEFLNDKPYLNYLSNSDCYYIIASTLGIEFDNKIKYLSKTNLSKMVIMDATASAYLEYKTDEVEKTFNEKLDFRFCPGYSKTKIEDLVIISKVINSYKIGIEVTESYMLNPQKSMIGIVRVIK